MSYLCRCGALLLLAAPFVAQPAEANTISTRPTLSIVDVTVIDGTGAPPRPSMTVRVAGERIVAIEKTSGAKAYSGKVVDGHGRYLVPGFIDSNSHVTVYGQPSRRDTSSKYGDRNEELALEVAQRSLKAGVTTLVDSYGVLPPSIVVRDKINRHELVGSRLLLAGNILGWGGTFSLSFSLTKPSDLSVFEEKWNDLMAQDMGEEIMDMTPDELRVAMNHYLDKGVDVIKYGGTSHFMHPSLIGFSPAQQAVTGAEKARRLEMLDEQVDIQRRNAVKLLAAGCRITPATDSFLGDAPEFRREPKPDEAEPGMGTIRAIEGLVEIGMTPMEALVAATRNGAAANFLSADLGSIEPGKIADLVLLEADPLADIHNIETVRAVVARGNAVDLKSLPEHPLFSPEP